MSKKMLKNADEIEAIGAVNGALNLGLVRDEKVYDIVKKYAPKYKQVVYAIRGLLSRYCESDEEYDGMLDECKHWMKEAAKNDVWVVEQWEKECKKYGISEEHTFLE